LAGGDVEPPGGPAGVEQPAMGRIVRGLAPRPCGAGARVFPARQHRGAVAAPDSYLFWYRFGAGVVLSGVFLARGFAVAAWTHFLYDLMVMLLGR
jgi:hypothetical protein